MTTKAVIIACLNDSVETLFRNVRALPADKLEWAASETSRTPLSMLQECSQAPLWSANMLRDRSMESFNEEALAQSRSDRDALSTIDACEVACRESVSTLIKQIEAFPEEDMEQTLFLPFTNKDHGYWDIMGYPYWNNMWHAGQIAFIQTMLGDTEQH